MFKISFILRSANKQGNSPVSVKHSHTTLTPFVKATGISVPQQYFNTLTGKVSSKVVAHVEYNATIEQVRTDIEKAVRNILAWGKEPDRETVSREYDSIINERISANVICPTVSKHDSKLDQLKSELAELELQVSRKKTEIRECEMSLGSFNGKLLSTYTKLYRDTQKLAFNTKRTYNNLLKCVNDFNHLWDISEVTPGTLINFENFLISTGLNNSTTNIYIKRVKTVVLKYADILGINKELIRDHKTESKQLRKQDIIFLTEEELAAFKALEVPTRREVVKDCFLLMVSTGLRFSDSFITPDKVKGNFIVLHTKKTDTLVKIPINNIARSILDKYACTMPKQYLPNFNRVLKLLAEEAGINELVHTSKRVGAIKSEDYLPKYRLISAHVGRKTFISHALANGVNPAVLKLWIGHSRMEMMFTSYASGSINTVEEMNKLSTI